jgi:hypothetical protein
VQGLIRPTPYTYIHTYIFVPTKRTKSGKREGIKKKRQREEKNNMKQYES